MSRIRIRYKRRILSVDVKETNFFTRGTGLMFKSRNTKNLVFYFGKPVKLAITSFFVFFPFLAVWLDKNYKVVHKEIVMPWKFALKPKKEFYSLVEFPINSKNVKIIEFFVGKGNI